MTIKVTALGIFNALDRLTNENTRIELIVDREDLTKRFNQGTLRLVARDMNTRQLVATFWVNAPASDAPLLDALATIGNQYINELYAAYSE